MDDAVAVDLRACAEAALRDVPPSTHADVLRAASEGEPCGAVAVLDAAAALLVDHTEAIAAAFRGVVIDLVLRLGANDTRHGEVLHTYARLAGAFEEAFEPIYDYVQRHFVHGICEPSEARLLAQYRLTRAAPELAQWPVAPLQAIFTSDAHPTLRSLAIECFAMQEHLAPAAADALVQRWIGDTHTGGGDARLRAIAEDRRIASMWGVCSPPSTHPLRPTAADLCPQCRVVGGIILYSRGERPAQGSFVVTRGAAEALREVALRHALRLPVLLSGPPACGKTHLVEHLAAVLRTHSHGAPRYSRSSWATSRASTPSSW